MAIVDNPSRASAGCAQAVPFECFLPYTEKRKYSKGEVLFRYGDPADVMFFIGAGAIHLVEIGKSLGKGDLVGEMGLLCPSHKRTVSAICESDVVLHLLDRSRFLNMINTAPRDFFSLIQLAISRYSENLENEIASRIKLESELRIAHEIQTSSLPSTAGFLPPMGRFEISASMKPAKEVGGDFYDFFPVGPDNWFMAIGDVCGKGVPAALFMMTVKTLLKAEALSGSHPGDILQRVNRIVCQDNSAFMFVTILCVNINLKTGHTVFGNAGHCPPLLKLGSSNFQYLEIPPCPVLGYTPDAVFTSREFELQKDDALFLYTDGIPEAANQAWDFFGEERLLSFMKEMPSANLETIISGVKNKVTEFIGLAPQSDDLTMLAFRFKGAVEKANSPPSSPGS